MTDDAEQWVLDEVRERTEPAHDAAQILGRLWTSRHSLLHERTGRGRPTPTTRSRPLLVASTTARRASFGTGR